MKILVLIAMLFAIGFSTILPEGEYQISCKFNNKVLDIEKSGKNDGANLIIYSWKSGSNQKFYLKHFEGEWVTLVAKHSNKALAVTGKTAGTGYQQATNTESPQQLFRISRTSDGYYLIKNFATGYVLNCNSDAKSAINNRLAVQQGRDCSDAQKFVFTRLDI